MLQAKLAGPDAEDSLHTISSISPAMASGHDGRLFRHPVWKEKARLETANVEVDITIPAGQWKAGQVRLLDVTWKEPKHRKGCHVRAWTSSSRSGTLPSGGPDLDEEIAKRIHGKTHGRH